MLYPEDDGTYSKTKFDKVMLNTPACPDDNLSQEREGFSTEHVSKDLLKFRNNEHKKKCHNNDGDHHDDSRVHHG